MAESANTVRSNSFVLEELTEFQREKLKNGESFKFNFSKDVKKGNQISQMMGVSIFSLISPYKLFIKLKKLKFS